MASYSVEPCDLLLALDITRYYFPGLKLDDAKMQAICLVDWAILNSDACPAEKLLKDAGAGYERGGT